jgi:hypothetical protein
MHGFRQGLSCDTMVYDMACYIDTEISSENTVLLVQFDISKAFDAVWHPSLLRILIFFNETAVGVRINSRQSLELQLPRSGLRKIYVDYPQQNKVSAWQAPALR